MKLNRRDIIKLGGAAALAGPSFLGAAKAPVAKAKSVIQIWMWGGPTHLDTFDPKPEAGKDYCGSLDKPIETNVKGMRIGQLLPKLAKQGDKFSILRSMTHGVNAHETASYLVQTGHKPGRLVYPSAGAVVSMFKGYKAGYKGIVPPYIVLTQAQGRFAEEGFLGPDYKPFATGGDPSKNPFMVEGIVAKGISDERQHARRKLMNDIDMLGKSLTKDETFQAVEKTEEAAYQMMFGDAKKLYDLSTEKESVREKYGMNSFGQSCLMARRLVEAGVPYITINYKGWDTHKQHFQTMNRKLPELDAGFAALLEDLSDRGLLDSTIVWWGGEFGRGPKVQWEAPWNGGRSHFGACFSSVVAGGGFKGGQIVGSSDATGSEVSDRPVTPKNMLGSMYTLLGIDPDGSLPNYKGLDLKVLPDTNEGDGILKEIMKS
ncbi:hypothetical protein BVX94_00265 [bacterium B17]|nr:hypothetical protein BVX94_00265 [bacterium B17]